ncbi:hypothetical protein DFQ11_101858 [Winogradskyella epiphytica]|uniref:NlpE-like protein n=1 Tax=Winogradskyella epiphytica TaxID=262005 RepID=A0A2V4YHN0_9FLAO|nr:hypothetical protein [Winogradskyella epiphytica]PYE83423.1 hypothetical protein DFQ11_101858 [Winogradskyella epiphytica]GGW58057.1 hypothetical protein GCM10008085_07160 [Winogradskyella epiphytica]
MIKNSLIIILALVLVACKNEGKQEVSLEENRSKSYDQNDGLITIKGDFVYYADAAVIQTPTEIYGVVIDEQMHALDKEAQAFKKEATDMVPVTVRVRKFEKDENEEGWQFKVEIKEILKVEAPDPETKDVIKLAK